jgi:hypothetical protein
MARPPDINPDDYPVERGDINPDDYEVERGEPLLAEEVIRDTSEGDEPGDPSPPLSPSHSRCPTERTGRPTLPSSAS